jgi:hypothetical protein
MRGYIKGILTWVWVSEQGADGQQHLADCERGAPLVLQDVQADAAIAVDVAVVDACLECDLQAEAGQQSARSPQCAVRWLVCSMLRRQGGTAAGATVY